MPDYGMDKELKAKQAAKYDPALEKEVVDWIEAVSGEKKGDQSVAEWLKNGRVLCAVANAIRPGIVKKVNTSTMPFKQMENITFFMNAAREIGVPESAMFGTPDLFEEKNLGSVINCIYTFGGVVQVSCPEFAGPKLGVAMHVESKSKKRESTHATQSGGLAGTLEVDRPTERADYCVKPISAPSSTTSPSKPPPASGGGSRRASPVPPVSVGSAGASSSPAPVASGTPNDQCVYGIDKDIKEKLEAKFDVGLESEVIEWIEGVTGQKKGDQSLAAWLKDGQVLCALANGIKPGIITKKVNSSSIAFKQMENITYFMNAARDLGVPETALFGTPDLYEEKNMPSVVNCIYTFGGAIQVSVPDYAGPKLGIAMNVEAKSKKRASAVFVDQTAGLSTKMEVARPTERADYCVKPIDRGS